MVLPRLGHKAHRHVGRRRAELLACGATDEVSAVRRHVQTIRLAADLGSPISRLLPRLPVNLWEVATSAAAVARAAERAQVPYPVPTSCRLVLYVIDGEVVFGTACQTPEAVMPEDGYPRGLARPLVHQRQQDTAQVRAATAQHVVIRRHGRPPSTASGRPEAEDPPRPSQASNLPLGAVHVPSGNEDPRQRQVLTLT